MKVSEMMEKGIKGVRDATDAGRDIGLAYVNFLILVEMNIPKIQEMEKKIEEMEEGIE